MALALRAQILLETWRDLDSVIASAREAAAIATALGEGALARRALGLSALAFARMRARRRAEGELERARALGDAPELTSVQAKVLLGFDERVEAMALFTRCTESSEARRDGLLGRAQLSRIVGDFRVGHEALDALGAPGPCEIAARAERARIYLSERRWAEALDAIEGLLSASPHSEMARARKEERAAVLMRLGRRNDAIHAYDELLVEYADDRVGRHAVRSLQRLRDDACRGRPRKRLDGFGTVTQLRNHCGPACAELVLRYYGIAADQIEIGRAIKEVDGTPMYALRAHLEASGLHVRRLEADLALIKRVLDAGVPLIVEEEYSSSTHVAIAVGYDDEREVLEVQDPMTHEVRETPYEALPRLLALTNGGAIVAVPNDAERIAALDAAGAREAAYIVRADEAFRALDGGHLEDAWILAEASIALRRDYELSWICKFHVARQRAAKDASQSRAVDDVLRTILELWPHDEWPRQLEGQVAIGKQEYEVALRAFERARERDDGDGRNWAMIGDCQIALGRTVEAIASLRAALVRMPWCTRAIENLAGLLEHHGSTAEAGALSDAARDLAPENPYNYEVAARLALARGENVEALALAKEARRISPGSLVATSLAARALHRLGRHGDAVSMVDQAEARDPSARMRAAQLLQELGMNDRAITLCDAILVEAPDADAARTIRAMALAGAGRTEEAAEHLQDLLRREPHHAWARAELGHVLAHAGAHAEAVRELGAALALGDAVDVRLAFAECLLALGAREDAAAQAKQAVRARRADLGEVRRAACVVLLAQGIASARALVDEAEMRMGIAPRASSGVAPRAQACVLAMGGILLHLNGLRDDALGGAARPSGFAANVLLTSWGIRTTEELHQRMEWFRREGDRQKSAREWRLTEHDLSAWDFMRMSAVAGWAYGACLIERSEAWALMVEAAEALQMCFGSFREAGIAYARARSAWLKEDSDEAFAAVEALLAPGGGWFELPWDVPLAGASPPEDIVVERHVEPRERLDEVLQVALQGVESRRVRVHLHLSPGTYPAPVNITGPVILEASAPGVILEHDGVEDFVVRVDDPHGGAILRGLVIRTTGHEDADALGVGDGLLRLEGCTVHACRNGLTVLEDGLAQVVGGVFDGCACAVYVQKSGYADLRQTTLHASSGAAIETDAEGEARLEECTVGPSAGNGVRCSGAVTLARCTFTANEHASVALLPDGFAQIERCVFSKGQCAIVAMAGAAQVVAADCTFRDASLFHVQIEAVKRIAYFERCRFEGAAPEAVQLAPGWGAVFKECLFTGIQRAAVTVFGSGADASIERAPHLVDCEVVATGGGAVFVQSGGCAVIDGLRARDFGAAALEARGAGSRLVGADCTLGPASKYGVCIHESATASLVRSSLERLDDANAIYVGTSASARIESCVVTDANRGIGIEEGGRVRLLDTTIDRCREVAIAVLGQSQLWMSGGSIRVPPGAEDSAYVQEGSVAIFDTATLDGCFNLKASHALFARCTLPRSSSAGISCYDRGLTILDRCELRDVAWSAVEAGDKGRVELLECRLDQEKGQSALFAPGGRIRMIGGRAVGGTEGIAEARDGGHVALLGVELVDGAGPRFETSTRGKIVEKKAPPAPLMTAVGDGWRAHVPVSDAPERDWAAIARMLVVLRTGDAAPVRVAFEEGVVLEASEREPLIAAASAVQHAAGDDGWRRLAETAIVLDRIGDDLLQEVSADENDDAADQAEDGDREEAADADDSIDASTEQAVT
jgi:tetratricopeptide (TPR) repeat protein